MKYISTRGHAEPQTFCDILLGGLAPDGGLYLPESYPQVTAAELAEWRELPYAALALRILQKYIDDTKMTIVAVGDRKVIEEQVKPYGAIR